MPTPTDPTQYPAVAPPRRLNIGLAGLAVVSAGLAVYANSLDGPFVYDDLTSIVDNASIRHLWPPWDILAPPHGGTVSGRPLLNLSFAFNYAFGGPGVGGYHVLNAAIHALAGLALLGIVHRTLCLPSLRARFGTAALPMALSAALLWTLHPLQTESVTYVVQRAESLAGLWFLLTLYCFIRAVEPQAPWGATAPGSTPRWSVAAIVACLLGMATKEIAGVAPVLVFCYDRTFVAGSFKEAWRRHRGLHIGLAGTCVVLVCLILGTGGNRDGSVGFGVATSAWDWWPTQFGAVTRYGWLACWPHPLVFDYTAGWVKGVLEVLPAALVVIALGAGTITALVRWPAAGFLSAWFFAILAPTSLVPGTTQMICEHRLYLPLAAVVSGAVAGLYALLGRRSLLVWPALAVALGALTVSRNGNYRSGRILWADTVAKQPDNARAYNNLGLALTSEKRTVEAEASLRTAIRLCTTYTDAYLNLGKLLIELWRFDEAHEQFAHALELRPQSFEGHIGMGNVFLAAGRPSEAAEHFRIAVQVRPEAFAARMNLGLALLRSSRAEAALEQFQAASRIAPDAAEAILQSGHALGLLGRNAEAMAGYEKALRLEPNSIEAHEGLANALAKAGRGADADVHYETALHLQPARPETHFNYGVALVQRGRLAEAQSQWEEALRLRPGYAAAREALRQLKAYQESAESGR